MLGIRKLSWVPASNPICIRIYNINFNTWELFEAEHFIIMKRGRKRTEQLFQRVTNITTYIFTNRFHTKILSLCKKKKCFKSTSKWYNYVLFHWKDFAALKIWQSSVSSLLIHFEDLMKKSYLPLTICFKIIGIHLTSCFLHINLNIKF